MDHGVPRLGIPAYMHLVETNTAVASTCLAPGKCSVNYPGPTGLGATFNRTVWRRKGELMGDEIRAFNNLRWYRATGDAPHSLIGLNGYGPNINIAVSVLPRPPPRLESHRGLQCLFLSNSPPPLTPPPPNPQTRQRDPRFGRTSELPGEDPFLSGTYAREMVRGGQGLDAYESGKSKHLKMTLGLKHYDLYSVEVDRPSFIPNVTAQDLWETYLAQYR